MPMSCAGATPVIHWGQAHRNWSKTMDRVSQHYHLMLSAATPRRVRWSRLAPCRPAARPLGATTSIVTDPSHLWNSQHRYKCGICAKINVKRNKYERFFCPPRTFPCSPPAVSWSTINASPVPIPPLFRFSTLVRPLVLVPKNDNDERTTANGRTTNEHRTNERTTNERTINEQRTNERATNKRTNERTNKRTNDQRTDETAATASVPCYQFISTGHCVYLLSLNYFVPMKRSYYILE